MIAFFDTSVHVEILRGRLGLDDVLSRVPAGPIRISPVVASELLRGSRGAGRLAVEKLVRRLARIEPPSWGARFLDAGRLLPKVFPDHERIGLTRLQNDALLALTARHTGAALVTLDAHFRTLQRHVPFSLVLLPHRPAAPPAPVVR